MENLNEFISSQSNYIGTDDFAAGFIVARFISYSIYPKTFQGKTSQTVGYKLILQGQENEKTLESASAKLAKQMNEVQPGELIKIEKAGQGFATTWLVTKASGASPITAESIVNNFGGKVMADETLPTIQVEQEEIDQFKDIPF